MRRKILSGGLIIIIFCLIALLAPWLSRYDPAAINQAEMLSGPSPSHWLGTDSLGRDLASRIFYGARVSLSIALIAVGISTLLGIAFGSIAGFYGNTAEAIIMRFTDIMLCFPSFFLILAAAALFEPSIFNIMLIIGATSWMGPARLIRAEILTLKEREFIQAARSIGASGPRIILRHLIPNAIAPVIVNATLSVAGAILIESGLSFLGLGVQPPQASWGNILSESKSTMGVAWWITLFPGLAIFLTISGFNLLAEGLKEKNEPLA